MMNGVVQTVVGAVLAVQGAVQSMIGRMYTHLETLPEVVDKVLESVPAAEAAVHWGTDVACLRALLLRRVFQRLAYIDAEDFLNGGLRKTGAITVGTFDTLSYVLGNVESSDVLTFPLDPKASKPTECGNVLWIRLESLDCTARIFGSACCRRWTDEGLKACFVCVQGALNRLVGFDMESDDWPGAPLQAEAKQKVVIIRYDLDHALVCTPNDLGPVVAVYDDYGVGIKARVKLGWVPRDSITFEGNGPVAKYSRPHLCWRSANLQLWARFRVTTVTPEGVLNLC